VRILVATDAIGAMSSRQAGELIASSWRRAAEISVLPIGEAGAGFATAYADLAGIRTSTHVADGGIVTIGMGLSTALVEVHGSGRGTGIPYQKSSCLIGEAMATVLGNGPPERVLVDLAGLWVHDAGAGMLTALGALGDRPLDQGVEALSGLRELDLAPARALLAQTELVGVVPLAQLDQPLLGLRGITSRTGREASVQPQLMLDIDATLQTFAELAAPGQVDAPGAGACGGLGFAVMALGGRLTTGPAIAFSSPDGKRGLQNLDLVVTGCSVYDFASRGGGVVAAVAEAASVALSPCIVIAGEVVIGSREMRTMGIEAAYAVRESVLDDPRGDVSVDELAATARRVARSWTW
jgi:glycerate 2-kinase